MTALKGLTGKTEYPTVTIEQAIRDYLDRRYRQGELSECSYSNFGATLGVFARMVGPDMSVSLLCREHIEEWLENRHVRDSTRRTDLSIVRTFCQWLTEREHVVRDPSLGIKGPRQPRRVPRGVPRQGIEAVVAACGDERERLIILLEAHLGLRAIEISRLERGDINLFGATATVVGKGRHERRLPLTEEVAEAIVAYYKAEPASAGKVIRSRIHPDRGVSAAYISQIAARLFYEAGVKQHRHDGMGGHALRHAMAQRMLDRGASWRAVQGALGHAGPGTVAIYAGTATISELRETMEGDSFVHPGDDAA